MDVLLINPRDVFYRAHAVMPPLGLSYIGCALEGKGLSVEILDLEIRPGDFDLHAYINDLSPKIVGISGTSLTRFESFRIANIAKRVSREIFTVYGGVHATFTAEDTLAHIADIDCIIHGEGEETFLELAGALRRKNKDLEDIKGISFRQDGRVVQTAPRERIADLDGIPYSRHLLEMEKYDVRLDFLNVPSATVITSRGCPYNCNFCSASAMFGRKCTMRSAKNVVDEIRYCVDEFKAEGIKFFDSTLTFNRKHILSIAEELKARGLRLPWECEIRVDTVDKPLLERMKSAGCYYVDIGIESASEKVLKAMNKKITIERAVEVLKWCRELGIKTKVFFTFGHAQETLRDSMETVRFMDRYYDYVSKFGLSTEIRIYPGTPLERYAREKGFLPKGFSWSEGVKDTVAARKGIPLLVQPCFGVKEREKVDKKLRWLFFLRKLDSGEYFKKYTVKKIIARVKEQKSFSGLLFLIAAKTEETFKVLLRKK